jgi:putative transposase
MYRSRDEAKADVIDYIERFYNPKRRHSTIGYQTFSNAICTLA